MTLKSGCLHVDCSNCVGRGRLDDRDCFMGLSERLMEGFSGNLVLSSKEERLYTGDPVDTLVRSSEIFQGIQFTPQLSSGEKLNSISRMRLNRFSRKALMIYKEDPVRLTEKEDELTGELSAITGGNPTIMRHWEKIMEDTSRMIKRNRRNAKRSGTNP